MTGTQAQGRAYAEQRKRIAAQVKETLVRRLDLDRGADEIPDDCPLFGIGLCLDSIDALEIGVAVEDELGVRIEYGEMKKMQSVNAIVDLILERRDGRPDTARRVHQRTRTGAGLADLEAWTQFEVIGPDACEAIDVVVGCNVRDLFEGRAAQTLIPSPTGGVEAIVWVMALESSYRIVAEPAERAAVGQALTESTGRCNAEYRDIGEEQFALALIGPEAERVARRALGDEVESIALLNVLPIGRPPVLAARLVHFGEYELHLFGEAGGKQALVERLERAAGEDLPRIGNDALAAMASRRRFSVAIRSSAVSRSTSHARMASASLTRHPVRASVRASVCTVGFGWARAAARKRARSSAVRDFRPRASTSATSGRWGTGDGVRAGHAGMLRYSYGNDHRVDFPGLLRASLAGDRARVRTPMCLETFQNADCGTGPTALRRRAGLR